MRLVDVKVGVFVWVIKFLVSKIVLYKKFGYWFDGVLVGNIRSYLLFFGLSFWLEGSGCVDCLFWCFW